MTPSPEAIEWRQVGYLLVADKGRREDFTWEYTLTLPHFLAAWDVWDYWERPRVHSMAAHLTPSDVLIDVGAEVAWCSIVYAHMVGPENMVLVEPSSVFWPNIMHTWQHNFDRPPRACVQALVGAEDKGGIVDRDWPAAADGPLFDGRHYTYLHNDAGKTPQITLDTIAETVQPTAVTIDVEGAELVVLRGATELLIQVRPKLWVSVHPDLAERDYQTTTEDLYAYLAGFDYRGEVLGVDHETHMIWLPND